MFVWDTARPGALTAVKKKQLTERRNEMYRRELEDRAGLLFRLGYPAARAKARIRAQVTWDFDLHGAPKHASEIDKIVDAVYRRGGPGAGTPNV